MDKFKLIVLFFISWCGTISGQTHEQARMAYIAEQDKIGMQHASGENFKLYMRLAVEFTKQYYQNKNVIGKLDEEFIQRRKRYWEILADELYVPLFEDFQKGDTMALFSALLVEEQFLDFASRKGGGSSIKESEKKLFLDVLEHACRTNYPTALFMKAKWHLSLNDSLEAKQYLKNADKLGDPRAVDWYNFGILWNPQKAKYDAAFEGNLDPIMDEMSRLGIFPDDLVTHIRLYPHFKLAKSLLNLNSGGKPDENYDKAFSALKKWIKNSNNETKSIASAKKLLGDIHMMDLDVFGQRNYYSPQKAFKYYLESAEEGNAFAQLIIGDFYKRGQMVQKNYEKAIEWYQRASDNNHRDGYAKIGLMYEYGFGTEKSKEIAIEYYLKSANMSSPLGQRGLKRLNSRYLHNYPPVKSKVKTQELLDVISSSNASIKILFAFDISKGQPTHFDTIACEKLIYLSRLAQKNTNVEMYYWGKSNYFLEALGYKGEVFDVIDIYKRKYITYQQRGKVILKESEVALPEFHSLWRNEGTPAVFVFSSGDKTKFFARSSSILEIMDYIESEINK